MEINAGMDANSSVIPINSTSVKTQEYRSDCNMVVLCTEDLTPWEVSKTRVWRSMGLRCPMILMHFFVVPAFVTWGKKKTKKLQECCLFLCIIGTTVLHLMTLPCSERCSET